MNPTLTRAALVGACLALALPGAAADPTVSVPDPSFAATGAQAFAASIQGAATAFAGDASGSATAYAAALQAACAAPAPPPQLPCSLPVPTGLATDVQDQAGRLADGAILAARAFAESGVQSNVGAIVATKGDEAHAIADAVAGQVLPATSRLLDTVLGSFVRNVCDVHSLTPAQPGPPDPAGLCGADTLVGHARADAGTLYDAYVGAVGAATLTPFCDGLNVALANVGPAGLLPCAQLPQGTDVTALLPPAP
ncbi:MAG: hypothetical protein QOI63_419 [Thermoplasmata archaeon]|jgi:hypothetical protein|nr:hypothetical protein [Thermoplasmata archaeon]